MRLWLVLLVFGACAQSHALELARDGMAQTTVTLAAEATAAEAEAARELILYLELATGASFELRRGGLEGTEGTGIQVGSPGEAEQLGPEEWVISSSGDRLSLYGGRPRGTLYAVYRFLEEHVGVRWWTPHDQFVPRLRRLEIPEILSRGEPAFGYRDIYGFRTEPSFAAHSRLNGHFSRVPEELGGSEAYGPPRHVHTFYDYIPPEEYFESMPELFSMRQGMRSAGKSQLCLMHPGVVALVREKLIGYIESSRGERAPTRFSFSPNDWGGVCMCDLCRVVAKSSGGQSGLLARFINGLADSVKEAYPEVLVDTLAYGYTMPPPGEIEMRDNVVVRFSALQHRKMSRPLDDPVNRVAREALDGWLEATSHLIVWDYAVGYGPDGDLPLANLPVLADDFRLYLESGAEGIFLQQDYLVGADMRALKLWVLAKLMEEPHRDLDRLVEQFTDGYYGAAGKRVRRYLDLLGRTMARRSPEIGYGAAVADYKHLDRRFLVKAQTIFDRAEKSIKDDAILLRRLRHARLSLDRATLLLLPAGDHVAERYRNTWRTEIMNVYPESERAEALADVERELSVLLGHRYNLQSIATEDRP